MKYLKLYEEFEEEGAEGTLEFPEPIIIGKKEYKNTDELLKDFKIGTITNFNDEIELDGIPYKEWVPTFHRGPLMDTQEEGFEGEEQP